MGVPGSKRSGAPGKYFKKRICYVRRRQWSYGSPHLWYSFPPFFGDNSTLTGRRERLDYSGVVVHHCGQPGTVRFTVCAENEDVELGVVCLPYLVRPFSPPAVHEFVPITVRRRPLQGEGDEHGIQGRTDVPNGEIARRRSIPLSGIGDSEPVQGCKARSRLRQSETFDERHGIFFRAAPAGIDSGLRIQRRDATVLERSVPALKRAQADL